MKKQAPINVETQDQAEKRKTRKRKWSATVGSRNIINVGEKDPNFVYRMANDQDDRIPLLQERGYEIAPKTTIGDESLHKDTPLGSVSSRSVGGGVQGVLMRIPKEFYEEDLKLKAEAIAKTEEKIYKDAEASGFSGDLKIQHNKINK